MVKTRSDERAARLAKALRANLRRRKASRPNGAADTDCAREPLPARAADPGEGSKNVRPAPRGKAE